MSYFNNIFSFLQGRFYSNSSPRSWTSYDSLSGSQNSKKAQEPEDLHWCEGFLFFDLPKPSYSYGLFLIFLKKTLGMENLRTKWEELNSVKSTIRDPAKWTTVGGPFCEHLLQCGLWDLHSPRMSSWFRDRPDAWDFKVSQGTWPTVQVPQTYTKQ